MVDRLEYFAFFRKSTSFYRAYNVKVTPMLEDMVAFFTQTTKKSLPTFSVGRLNIKIKRCASIIQPSAPLPEQPLQQVPQLQSQQLTCGYGVSSCQPLQS